LFCADYAVACSLHLLIRACLCLQIIKRRYEMTPAPYRRRMRNVLTFLYSGLYNITYPKTNARGRSDSLNSVGTAAGGSAGSAHAHAVPDPRSVGSLSPVHSSPAEEKAQYQQALRMLKGIDQKLSGESSVGLAELGAGAVPPPPLPAVGKCFVWIIELHLLSLLTWSATVLSALFSNVSCAGKWALQDVLFL
jgi:hypothetical protein